MDVLSNCLVVDFETDDKLLTERGPGWVFKDCDILCMSYVLPDNTTGIATTAAEYMELYNKYPIIVCHNALYDIGWFYSLGLDIEDKLIIDTAILCHLDNNMLPVNLDDRAYYYFSESKCNSDLYDIATKIGIRTEGVNPKTIEKNVKKNMAKLYVNFPEVVKKYAIQDAVLCKKILRHLVPSTDPKHIDLYSTLIVDRIIEQNKGMKIDINRADEVKRILEGDTVQAKKTIQEIAPDLNTRSSKQKAEFCDIHNIEYNTTEKGNPSFTGEWMDKHPHPLFKAIAFVNKAKKYEDYINKYLELQDIYPSTMRGRLYPQILPLIGTSTGRFCSSKPNIQNVPKRDEKLGPLMRSIFVPDEGTTMYALDYSQQEPRILINYAYHLNPKDEKLIELIDSYNNNPEMSIYKWLVKATNNKLSLKEAKAVKLGMSYNMGNKKFSKYLGVSEGRGWQLRSIYYKAMPFEKEYKKAIKHAFNKQGYIRSLGGRKLKAENAHKAINMPIQGSAGDQIILAMVEARKAGVPARINIHDELVGMFKTEEEAILLKKIMEQSMKLIVPSISEIRAGNNWGEMHEI